MWRMRLTKDRWEAIAPDTRAPGEGLPVEAGRYGMMQVKSKWGPMLICRDVSNGYVYRMPSSGEGGWKQLKEPTGDLERLDRIPATGDADVDSEPVIVRDVIGDTELAP